MSVIAICVFCTLWGKLVLLQTCFWKQVILALRGTEQITQTEKGTISLGVNPSFQEQQCIQPQAVSGCSELLYVEIKDRIYSSP